MRDDSLTRLNELAEGLLLATSRGELPWGALDDETFALEGRTGRILIRSATASGDHPYALIVLDPEGNVVERASTTRGDFYHDWERRFADLYASARASALNIDRVIRNLREEFAIPVVDIPPIEVDDF